MGNPSLYEMYLDRMAEEGPIPLEAFLDRVLSGEFGSFSKTEILMFLDEMEQQTLASMMTFSEARGIPEEQLLHAMEEERKKFSKLKERIQE